MEGTDYNNGGYAQTSQMPQPAKNAYGSARDESPKPSYYGAFANAGNSTVYSKEGFDLLPRIGNKQHLHG